MRKIKFLVNPNNVGHRVCVRANDDKKDGQSYAIMNFDKLTLSEAIDKIEEIQNDITRAEIWGYDYSNGYTYEQKCVAIYGYE